MRLHPDVLLFAIALVNTGAVLFILAYFLFTLSKLDTDRINTRECCLRLNKLVLVKALAQCFLCCLLFLYGHWYLLILNLPIFGWVVYKMITVRPMYDPVAINNRGHIADLMKTCITFVGYFFGLSFVYIYCMIEGASKIAFDNKEEMY